MPPERQSPQPEADASQVFMMFFLLIFMLVIFTPELREWMGTSMGGVLEPVIGFDHTYPVFTIFLAGMVMIFLSTSIRHFFIDWMEMARIQKMMFAFNKELREAQIARNQRRVEKLMELQPEVMRMNAQLSSNQMKPMMFTMMVAIPIFMWLHSFVGELSFAYVSIPWQPYWGMEDRFLILPQWVLIYSFLTLPVGQLYMRWLKIRELRQEVDREEEHIEDNAVTAISSAEKTISTLKSEGVSVEDLEEEMKEGTALLKKGEFRQSMRSAEGVRKKAKARVNQMENAKEHLRSLEDMREMADPDESAERDFISAGEAFEKGDFASSIYYAKQAKKVLIEGVAQKEYREAEITRIRDSLEEDSLDPVKVEECIQRAVDSRDRDEFDEHIEQAEREIDNAMKEKDSLLALKNDIIRKISESPYFAEFDEDLRKVDDIFMNRDFVEVKRYLEELNMKALRRIKGIEGE
jgi:uncharacterized membrane protein (DUF106 family)/HEPN domain-containing protein